MAGWYDTHRRVDARILYDGVGAIGRGISGVGGAMSGYAKLKYQKEDSKAKNYLEKAKLDLGYDTNRTKEKVSKTKYNADIYGADAKVKSSQIGAKAKIYNADVNERNNIRSTKTDIFTTKLNVGAKDRATQAGERNNIRATSTQLKSAKIGANAKVTSAKLGYAGRKVTADASIYGSNISASNNRNTNATLLSTTKEKTKTQKYVSDNNVKSAKIKAKFKGKTKNSDWLNQALKRAKTSKEREEILNQHKRLQELDNFDLGD